MVGSENFGGEKMFTYKDYQMRPLAKEDLDMVLEWRNSDYVRSKMLTDHIISLEEHRAWFERLKKSDTMASFIFEYKGKSVGYVSYNDIDYKNETCTSGLYLGEQEGIPKSLGIAMEYMILEYAFSQLKMRKLWGHIFSFNKRVIELHKFFGYKQEGLLIQHVKKDRQYCDLLIMSLFKEDWELRRETISKHLFD